MKSTRGGLWVLATAASVPAVSRSLTVILFHPEAVRPATNVATVDGDAEDRSPTGNLLARRKKEGGRTS
jgi:hypothetical protein